mmetsp:Transcript_31138/g.46963  ORF Transcript_31138/g.46963 Transcript_31138/m.46963 type:complete len:88 (-) Transcript_31138:921-1184(-)
MLLTSLIIHLYIKHCLHWQPTFDSRYPSENFAECFPSAAVVDSQTSLDCTPVVSGNEKLLVAKRHYPGKPQQLSLRRGFHRIELLSF